MAVRGQQKKLWVVKLVVIVNSGLLCRVHRRGFIGLVGVTDYSDSLTGRPDDWLLSHIV